MKGGTMGSRSEKIKEDILAHLDWDLRVNSKSIEVDVMDGNVRLSGKVPTMTARIAAQMDTCAVPGVKTIKNDLEVENLRDISKDEDIQSRTNKMLQWNSDIDQSDIDIAVSEGNVMLKGFVKTFWEKIQVEALVGNISGVKNVQNELVVVPSEKIVDKLIAQNISAALDRNSYIKDFLDSIYIKVEDGNVTASGNVPNHSVHRSVMNIISFTSGVIDVTDNLMIG
jgi:osmotically-inducible protein OsmY